MHTPNLFLIGTQKGGSSSLFDHLAAHPDVSDMGRKELNVFNAPTADEARARLTAFAPTRPGRPWRIDASVDYTRFPKFRRTPDNILEICGPDVRFVYVIRNPVDRLISNHQWVLQRYGGVADLGAAIRQDPQLVETGRYDVQLREYLRIFPRERFLFATFESFSADPGGVANGVCRWLGITERPIERPDLRRGATGKATSRRLRFGRAAEALWSQRWLRDLARATLPERTIRRLARRLTVETERVEPTREEKRALMRAHFAESVRATAALTGLDLSAWVAAYD